MLVLAAQRDAAGFDALVARWQPDLLRYIQRMTLDEAAAWDVVQETWFSVVRGLRRLEQPEAFPAWAFRIATNKCRDWGRRQTRRGHLLERYETETANTPGETAGNLDDRLERALGRLAADLREPVALYYEQQMSIREISDALGIKTGTVKTRLYRARRELNCIQVRYHPAGRNLWTHDLPTSVTYTFPDPSTAIPQGFTSWPS